MGYSYMFSSTSVHAVVGCAAKEAGMSHREYIFRKNKMAIFKDAYTFSSMAHSQKHTIFA